VTIISDDNSVKIFSLNEFAVEKTDFLERNPRELFG
jgi:hypothetical protein